MSIYASSFLSASLFCSAVLDLKRFPIESESLTKIIIVAEREREVFAEKLSLHWIHESIMQYGDRFCSSHCWVVSSKTLTQSTENQCKVLARKKAPKRSKSARKPDFGKIILASNFGHKIFNIFAGLWKCDLRNDASSSSAALPKYFTLLNFFGFVKTVNGWKHRKRASLSIRILFTGCCSLFSLLPTYPVFGLFKFNSVSLLENSIQLISTFRFAQIDLQFCFGFYDAFEKEPDSVESLLDTPSEDAFLSF